MVSITGEIDNVVSEEQKFIEILNRTYDTYFEYGARSSKKVDLFHREIKNMLETHFSRDDGYDIKLEYNISSSNSSGKKKCDIVILKNEIPYIIFPVKLIMTNFKQNKNNSWENLTGELSHIKWMNPDIIIIPINIFINKTPYLKKNKEIKNFENIVSSDIQNYNHLIEHNLCNDLINYIIDVNHSKKETETFDDIHSIEGFSTYTPYRTFASIFEALV